MPKQNELLEQQLRQAFSQLTPDDAAKDRMYQAILQRAEGEQKHTKKPWYLHWQASAGFSAAAVACAAVVVVSLHGRMPRDGTDQLVVVEPPAVVTTAAEETSSGSLYDETAQTSSAVKASCVTECTVSQTKTAAQTVTIAMAEQETAAAVAAEVPFQETIPREQEPSGSARPQVTEAPRMKQSEPSVTEAVQPTETSPAQTTAEKSIGTSAQTITETTDAKSTPGVHLRNNYYLYYQLKWKDRRYDTEYTEVSGKDLENYLGYGVTRGNDVDDTFTVLIYSIRGLDPAEQLAVQYVGEDAYFLFNVQELETQGTDVSDFELLEPDILE